MPRSGTLHLRTVRGDEFTIDCSADATISDIKAGLKYEFGFTDPIHLVFDGNVLANNRLAGDFVGKTLFVSGAREHRKHATPARPECTPAERTPYSVPRTRRNRRPTKDSAPPSPAPHTPSRSVSVPSEEHPHFEEAQRPAACVIEIKTKIPHLGKEFMIKIENDRTVDDLINTAITNCPEILRSNENLKQGEDGNVEKSPINVLFFDRYLDNKQQTLRTVPLTNGSVVSLCTGPLADRNCMALFRGERIYDEVEKAIAANSGELSEISKMDRLHYNEILMKALLIIDSVTGEGVDDTMRARRKEMVTRITKLQDLINAST